MCATVAAPMSSRAGTSRWCGSQLQPAERLWPLLRESLANRLFETIEQTHPLSRGSGGAQGRAAQRSLAARRSRTACRESRRKRGRAEPTICFTEPRGIGRSSQRPPGPFGPEISKEARPLRRPPGAPRGRVRGSALGPTAIAGRRGGAVWAWLDRETTRRRGRGRRCTRRGPTGERRGSGRSRRASGARVAPPPPGTGS